MKRPNLLILCLLALSCAFLLIRRDKETATSATGSVPTTQPMASGPRQTVAKRSEETVVNPGEISPPAPVSGPQEKDARITEIEEAATTYTPEGVKQIKPYLVDSNAEIREAAKDALVRLGEADGSWALRAAAKQLKDPREAAAYLEAADYLELPSFSDSEEARELATKVQEEAAGQTPPGQ